jgi:cycloeucalenol cycloisomerase
MTDSISIHDDNDVAVTMTAILGSMVAIIAGLVMIQTPKVVVSKSSRIGGRFLPDPVLEPSKRAYEIYALIYTPIWITGFGIIVAFGLYKTFDEWSYMKVCVGLSLPFLLQPVLLPSGFTTTTTNSSPDTHRPLHQRYSFKANVWIAVYSFIGNYWYTHYFYSVLKAKYTMPAHRLNNVPIALYFATHFYFSTYHVFSNLLLRKVITSYQPTISRHVLFVTVIVTFSYFTAFAETLTISSYPDYSFEDRYMAYTIGSAFYGIYFLVSFPAFYYFDSHIDTDTSTTKVVTVWDTVVSSCGYGMMIMILLDFVRLYLDIPLVVGGSVDDICAVVK